MRIQSTLVRAQEVDQDCVTFVVRKSWKTIVRFALIGLAIATFAYFLLSPTMTTSLGIPGWQWSASYPAMFALSLGFSSCASTVLVDLAV